MEIRPLTNSAASPSPVLTDRQSGAASVVAHAAQSAYAPAETYNPVQQPASVPSQAQLKQVVENINKALSTLSRDVVFSIDDSTDRPVVKVVDQNTKEVIRQIPTEETLEISKELTQALDKVQGLLIKQKA